MRAIRREALDLAGQRQSERDDVCACSSGVILIEAVSMTVCGVCAQRKDNISPRGTCEIGDAYVVCTGQIRDSWARWGGRGGGQSRFPKRCLMFLGELL